MILRLVGLAALLLAAAWVYGIAQLLDPNFNPRTSSSDAFMLSQGLIGFLGTVATLVAAGSAFAYARTGERLWLKWVAFNGACALPLLVAWCSLALAASAS